MMYPYMTLADETEIIHSHIIMSDEIETVEVHFERPTEDGFDSARCILYLEIHRQKTAISMTQQLGGHLLAHIILKQEAGKEISQGM